MLVCPLDMPPGLLLHEQEEWLMDELDKETLRRDSLECRVQRLQDALVQVQREMGEWTGWC